MRCGRCFYSTTNSVHLQRHNEDFHGQDTPVRVKAATSEVVIKAAEVTTNAGEVTIKAVEAAIAHQRNPVPSRDYTRKAKTTVMEETDMVTTDTTEGVSEADFLFDDETATEAEEVKEKVNEATKEVIKATPEVIPLLEIEAPKSDDDAKKKCPDCDFATDERYGITRHVRDVHGILAAAKCGLCKYEAEDDGFLLNLAKVRNCLLSF